MTRSHSTLLTCFVFRGRICFRSADLNREGPWQITSRPPHDLCSVHKALIVPNKGPICFRSIKQSDEYILGKQFISPQHFFNYANQERCLLTTHFFCTFRDPPFADHTAAMSSYENSFFSWDGEQATDWRCVPKFDIHYTSTVYTHSVHSSQFFLPEINPLGAGNQVPEVCLNSIIQ